MVLPFPTLAGSGYGHGSAKTAACARPLASKGTLVQLREPRKLELLESPRPLPTWPLRPRAPYLLQQGLDLLQLRGSASPKGGIASGDMISMRTLHDIQADVCRVMREGRPGGDAGWCPAGWCTLVSSIERL